jgi:CHAT domain-containing protein
VRSFREAIESGNEPAHRGTETEAVDRRAEELYAVLFGELNPQETAKRDWLVSPADALLELPFAALVPRKEGGRPLYLAELHSLKIESGARPSDSAPRRPSGSDGSLVAVGDPIYNLADPRSSGPTGLWRGFRSWFGTTTAQPSIQLNRLPGSGREAASVAHLWSRSTLLEGADATKERFEQTLKAAQPGTIHLATHVLALRADSNQEFLAFGLGAQRGPELMGTSEVAMLNVPGALVVMTGCESAGGDLRSGVGLENLARAWMLAGARAVVATQWPVRDTGGEFLARFYENLRSDAPAAALQKAQIAAIRSGTRSSAPAEWAAYQVFGGGVE